MQDSSTDFAVSSASSKALVQLFIVKLHESTLSTKVDSQASLAVLAVSLQASSHDESPQPAKQVSSVLVALPTQESREFLALSTQNCEVLNR